MKRKFFNIGFCFAFALFLFSLAQPAYATEPAPSISPGYSVFDSGPQTVTITDSDGGATLYYTIDGTTPTTSSTVYSGSFTVSSTTTVKAIAVGTGGTSSVTTSVIQIDSTTAGVSRTGLALWLKGDNGVITSGTSVTDWKDVSGNSMDASQSTSGNQPTFVSSAVNSLPAVQFDGSSDRMTFPSGFADFTNGATAFVVVKTTGIPSTWATFYEFGTANAYNTNTVGFFEGSSNSTIGYESQGSTYFTAPSSVTLNSYQIFDVLHGGTVFGSGTVDGVLKTTVVNLGNSPNTTRSTNYLGCSVAGSGSYFQGEMAELLVYNRALSESERKAVRGYLNARYALATSPPTIDASGRVFGTAPHAVTITADPGASIFYTTDGSTPTTSSTAYSGPFNISSTTTVKAIAVNNSITSSVATALLQYDTNSSNVARSGLQAWLRADNGATTSSGAVTEWLDISGNGNTGFQLNSSLRPTLISNAINSLPTVSFNGSQRIQLPSGFSNYSSGQTVFLVAKPSTLGGSGQVAFSIGNVSATNEVDCYAYPSQGFAYYLNNNGSSTDLHVTSGVPPNRYEVFANTHDGSNTAKIFVNGIEATQSTAAVSIPTAIRGANYLGTSTATSYSFVGEIAEVLVYDRALTATERQNLETYLSARYGITPVPPTIGTGMRLFSASTSISMSAPFSGEIRYTDDGSTPTPSSTLYTAPITVSSTKTLKAIAISPMANSSITSSKIQIDPDAAGVLAVGTRFLWLKADNGPVVDGSNKVSLWEEISGNGLDASQSTGSAQPTFNSSAINTLPAVAFDGSSQFFSLPSVGGLSDASIFVVTKPTSSIPTDATLFDLGNNGSYEIALSEPTSSELKLWTYSGSTPKSFTGLNAITPDQYQVLSAQYDSTTNTGTLMTDGVKQGFGPAGQASNTHANNYIGRWYNGTGFFKGEIAEILMFWSKLGEQDRQTVAGYLSKRYGLPTPPPSFGSNTAFRGTSGVFTENVSVGAYAPSGGTVRYTTDGSTPTGSSPVFSGMSPAPQMVLKAMTTLNGITSPVATINLQYDNTTVGVPRTGLILWLKPDFGLTTSGGSVVSWEDMSGAGNDATQTNSSLRPTFSNTSVFGRPGITFNGSSQYLQLSPMMFSYFNGMSLFAIAKPGSLVTGATLLDIANGATSDNLLLAEQGTAGSVRFHVYNGSSDSYLDNSSAISANHVSLIEAIQSGSGSATMYTNGIQGSTGSVNNPNSVARASNFIGKQNGGVNFYPGALSEILLYNRALTAAERANVESYLLQRYQVLASQVTAPPIISVATGTLAEPVEVAISAPADVEIRYTLDGSTPSSSSALYSGPVPITYSQTLKAIAIRNGLESSVASATYTLDSTKWPAPNASDTTPPTFNLEVPSTGIAP